MILDINNNLKLNEITISESYLQKQVVNNFKLLFPDYKIISPEYKLQGDVRKFGISGRIDIFAFNLNEFRLTVFELKRENNKNILFQAIDYTDFIVENYALIVLNSPNLSDEEKRKLLHSKLKPEIILIAKKFNHPTIRRLENIENKIKLYEYRAFENDLIYFDIICNKGDNKVVYYKSEKITYEQIDSTNVNILIKECIKNIDESSYLIESNVLFINATVLYDSFKLIADKFNLTHLTKGNFLKLIRESNFYLEERKTMRFKKYNTSVIIMSL